MTKIRGNGFIALEISKYLRSVGLVWQTDFKYKIGDGHVELSCSNPRYETFVAMKFGR